MWGVLTSIVAIIPHVFLMLVLWDPNQVDKNIFSVSLCQIIVLSTLADCCVRNSSSTQHGFMDTTVLCQRFWWGYCWSLELIMMSYCYLCRQWICWFGRLLRGSGDQKLLDLALLGWLWKPWLWVNSAIKFSTVNLMTSNKLPAKPKDAISFHMFLVVKKKKSPVHYKALFFCH